MCGEMEMMERISRGRNLLQSQPRRREYSLVIVEQDICRRVQSPNCRYSGRATGSTVKCFFSDRRIVMIRMQGMFSDVGVVQSAEPASAYEYDAYVGTCTHIPPINGAEPSRLCLAPHGRRKRSITTHRCRVMEERQKGGEWMDVVRQAFRAGPCCRDLWRAWAFDMDMDLNLGMVSAARGQKAIGRHRERTRGR